MKTKTRRAVARCVHCHVVFLRPEDYLTADVHPCIRLRHPAAHRPNTIQPNPTTPVA